MTGCNSWETEVPLQISTFIFLEHLRANPEAASCLRCFTLIALIVFLSSFCTTSPPQPTENQGGTVGMIYFYIIFNRRMSSVFKREVLCVWRDGKHQSVGLLSSCFKFLSSWTGFFWPINSVLCLWHHTFEGSYHQFKAALTITAVHHSTQVWILVSGVDTIPVFFFYWEQRNTSENEASTKAAVIFSLNSFRFLLSVWRADL